MDELEFRRRLYADPADPDRELLDAAAANPALQAILEDTQTLERDLRGTLTAVAAPTALEQRLRHLPDHDIAEGGGGVRRSTRALQYYAMAACLVLAVGLLFGLNRGSAPVASELVMGQNVIRHLYHEEAELDAIAAGNLDTTFTLPTVNSVMANAGTALDGASFLENMPVRYANPCLVLPGHQSAHLILQTADGPLNVIVIDNTPVQQEFTIRDERFRGTVIPMERGNLILIGEADGNVEDYRELFTSNVEWVI